MLKPYMYICIFCKKILRVILFYSFAEGGRKRGDLENLTFGIKHIGSLGFESHQAEEIKRSSHVTVNSLCTTYQYVNYAYSGKNNMSNKISYLGKIKRKGEKHTQGI